LKSAICTDCGLLIKFGVPDAEKRALGLRRLEELLSGGETDPGADTQGHAVGAALLRPERARELQRNYPELHAYLEEVMNEDGTLTEDP